MVCESCEEFSLKISELVSWLCVTKEGNVNRGYTTPVPVKHDNTVCYTLLLFAASGHLDII
jgi:hypothetical protein